MTDHVFLRYNVTPAMQEAMMEVYHPTKKDAGRFSCAQLNKILSEPASLKKLSRDSVRKSMRILTGGRSIRPLVAELVNSGELAKNCGDFLLCDPPVNWREKMVIH